MLSSEDRDRIADAIRDAEAGTAGEIVVVVAARASAYRSVTLLYALVGALVTPWPLILLTGVSAARIALIQMGVALALALLFGVPGRWRTALIPASIRRMRGREAAAREFAARGLSGTRHRTGVLIYVAVEERYAEVVADVGIAASVADEVWRETIVELVDALGRGTARDGLASAVRRVGAVLAEHAPRRPDDTDELPNKVIVI